MSLDACRQDGRVVSGQRKRQAASGHRSAHFLNRPYSNRCLSFLPFALNRHPLSARHPRLRFQPGALHSARRRFPNWPIILPINHSSFPSWCLHCPPLPLVFRSTRWMNKRGPTRAYNCLPFSCGCSIDGTFWKVVERGLEALALWQHCACELTDIFQFSAPSFGYRADVFVTDHPLYLRHAQRSTFTRM